jgi:predicted amidohydrolase YtcJ
METAFLPIFAAMPTPAEEVAWSRAGQMLYTAAGITTAHERATHAADVELIHRAAAGGANLIDVVAYPFILELDEVLAQHPPQEFGSYRNRVKLGGVKVTLDGSPQGPTAYFTRPYWSTDRTASTTGAVSSASPRTSSTAGSNRSTTSGCAGHPRQRRRCHRRRAGRP